MIVTLRSIEREDSLTAGLARLAKLADVGDRDVGAFQWEGEQP